MSRTYDSSGGEWDSYEDDDRTDEELVDSDMDDDSVGVCSCSEVDHVLSDDSIDEDDLFTVHIGIEQADPVCVKLQDLLRQGKI